MSEKGSYYNQDEWLEEYNHVFYYDLTVAVSDESDATDKEYSSSESDCISTDDSLMKLLGKVF